MGKKRDLSNPITSEHSGIHVQKSFQPQKYPLPAIQFQIRSTRSEPVQLSLTDYLPTDYPQDKVAFHPQFDQEQWRVDTGHYVNYTCRLTPGESVTTLYGITVTTIEEAREFLTQPELKITPLAQSSNHTATTSPCVPQIIEHLDGYEFEQFIGDLWTQCGWTTTVTSGSNDRGVDIRATRDDYYPRKQLIQVKCYDASNPVSGPDIQQYASLKLQTNNVDEVLIITTSRFTKPATELARDLNVKLIDGQILERIIADQQAHDIVNRFLTQNQNRARQFNYIS
ncbi:restriction endonuclease [Haladaptatus sp. SPP-AMP-3]|uniref:restriction endonuclease n=1 Tax=Haladaptatus sp. SPP-AMP-3 TaxID=3121295 RepID=UPI003C2EF24A